MKHGLTKSKQARKRPPRANEGAPPGSQNRANGKRFQLAMERALEERNAAERRRGKKKWDALVEMNQGVIRRGLRKSPDLAAVTLVRDTLDGRPAQAITNPDGGPLTIVVRKGLAGGD